MKFEKRFLAVIMAAILAGQSSIYSVKAEESGGRKNSETQKISLTELSTEAEEVDPSELLIGYLSEDVDIELQNDVIETESADDGLQEGDSLESVSAAEDQSEEISSEYVEDQSEESGSEEVEDQSGEIIPEDDESGDFEAAAENSILTEEDAQSPILSEDDLLIEEDPIEETTELSNASASSKNIQSVYQKTGKKLAQLAVQYPPKIQSINGEWHILGLARSNQSADSSVYSTYYGNAVKTIEEKKGVLDTRKYTEYSRVVIAFSALGYDVTDVAGFNLLEPLADFDQTVWQGVNGAIYALIAFDTHQYDIPKKTAGDTQTTREKLIAYILDKQLADGGWTLYGAVADSDMTAMALQSLAPYYSTDKKVKKAIDAGLVCLSKMQDSNGGFSSGGSGTAESNAQVVTALSTLGIDADGDERFIKNKKSVMDALLAYSLSDGMFSHTMNADADQMATEQAFYALTAYDRYKNNANSLYDMTDVPIQSDEELAAEAERLIDAISKSVTLADKDRVASARALYNSLSKLQKSLIPKGKVTKLKNAAAKINKLEIANVEKLIRDIGTVTKDKQDQIVAANTAYQSLTASQKKSVKNYSVLKKAIKVMRDLLSGSGNEDSGGTETKEVDSNRNQTGSNTQVANSGRAGATGSTSTRTAGGSSRAAASSGGSRVRNSSSSGSTGETGASTKKTSKNKTKSKEAPENKILASIRKLNDDMEDTTLFSKEEQERIIEQYLAVEKLDETVRQRVRENEIYDEFEGILETLGRQHHWDEERGIDFRENDGDRLPWYIQIIITPEDVGDYRELIQSALGEDGTLYQIQDIRFINVLDGSDWEPEEAQLIRMQLPGDFAEDENPLLVHVKNDGGLEFLDGEVSGSYIEFQAIDFSSYGLAGYAGTLEGLFQPEETQYQESGMSPWIIMVIALAGICILLVLLIRRIQIGKGEKVAGGTGGNKR